MAKGFSVNDILGGQSKPTAPAGLKMQVVMLPAADIVPNPDNAIYTIGDVSMLKADIAERGLRSPLEVLPAQGSKYMLLAGHRRWTACRELTAEGDKRFELLPCVIHASEGADDDLIALITSNATARELTDGERLRQFSALKQALERRKKAGSLTGRVRDEMSRITGDGTGTLGRLNAIINNCRPEVVEMVENGEITITRAYECSKLYKVQQIRFAKNGYASMETLEPSERRAVIDWLVRVGLRPLLEGLDYINDAPHSYIDHAPAGHPTWQFVALDEVVELDGQTYHVKKADWRAVNVDKLDSADHTELLAKSTIMLSDLYSKARELYVDKTVKAKKQDVAKQAAAETRRKKALCKKAQAIMADYDNWHKIATAKELGVTYREYPLQEGGRIVVMVDDDSYMGHVHKDRIPYLRWYAARYNADGKRVKFSDGAETDSPYRYECYYDARVDSVRDLLMHEVELMGG